MEPEISLIIACYNKEEYILPSINAVLSQSFQAIELIIVDDHSSDRSVEIIEGALAGDPRIRLLKNQENRGANYCRNAGLSAARARYVIFYDADDLLADNCLTGRMKVMHQNPTLDFAVFTMQVFRQKPGDTSFIWNPAVKNPLKAFLSHDLPWQTMQPIWKKSFITQLGGFDEVFKRLQDVELHTRALLVNGVNFLTLLGPPDCFYRIDESRKNFNAFNFMSRWVDSAILYCDKFLKLVPSGLKRFIPGTLFKTYLQVLHAFNNKELNKVDFMALESKIFTHALVAGTPLRKIAFVIAKYYNLYFPRIPGVNKILHQLSICGS